MMCRKTFITLLCLLALPLSLCALSLSTVNVVTASLPTLTVRQSDALAMVNDRAIMLGDLDPRIGELANSLEDEIAKARKSALEEKINSLLFEAEAKRRGISIGRLLDLEVTRHLVAPTAEEIQSLYDANRAQFGAADAAAARPQIVTYLNYENEKKLLADFASRLRQRYPVVMTADVNSPKLTPEMTLASVGGRPLSAGAIIERVKPIIYELRMRVYEAEKTAVEEMIYNLLILEAARAQGVGPEVIIRTEIISKLRSPTEAEIAKFYEEHKAHIKGDLDSMRNQIVQHLEQQEQLKLESALSDKLRTKSKVRVMLTEPEPPVLAISTNNNPSRGAVDAPVTVVVFTDFQCPACAFNHPLIEETIKAYGNRVRLVIRDFPLDMHPQARKAAEAANAAHAQGKFFEYAELLFKNQKSLDVASLKKYATEVGLNRARFDAALNAGTYAEEVNRDVADGTEYGINSTPTVFVNGVRVRNLNDEILRAAIDRALSQKK